PGGQSAWWTDGAGAFDNAAGGGFYLLVVTRGRAAMAFKAFVERAETHPERWSDHAPVTVVYELGA
ncbi:exodeoxyribonuclease III, partial [Streptomyces erythrochromogenes]